MGKGTTSECAGRLKKDECEVTAQGPVQERNTNRISDTLLPSSGEALSQKGCSNRAPCSTAKKKKREKKKDMCLSERSRAEQDPSTETPVETAMPVESPNPWADHTDDSDPLDPWADAPPPQSSVSFPSFAAIARPLSMNAANPIPAAPESSPHSAPTTRSATPPPTQFDFQSFLDQMKSRGAEPVAKYLRSQVPLFPPLPR